MKRYARMTECKIEKPMFLMTTPHCHTSSGLSLSRFILSFWVSLLNIAESNLKWNTQHSRSLITQLFCLSHLPLLPDTLCPRNMVKLSNVSHLVCSPLPFSPSCSLTSPITVSSSPTSQVRPGILRLYKLWGTCKNQKLTDVLSGNCIPTPTPRNKTFCIQFTLVQWKFHRI